MLVCETDHLLLRPMPNLATETEAVGYPFHYMLPTRSAKTRDLVRRFAGSDAAAAAVQQVGPSPLARARAATEPDPESDPLTLTRWAPRPCSCSWSRSSA